MPKCSNSINISGEGKEKLKTCVNNLQEQCGKKLSTGKQDRDMYPHYLYSSQISSKVKETTRVLINLKQ